MRPMIYTNVVWSRYNEKVDVYSYGMCLLELVSCKVIALDLQLAAC